MQVTTYASSGGTGFAFNGSMALSVSKFLNGLQQYYYSCGLGFKSLFGVYYIPKCLINVGMNNMHSHEQGHN